MTNTRVAAPAIKPDVPTQEIVPVDRVAKGGKALAPKVNNSPGGYRGVTPKMRAKAQWLMKHTKNRENMTWHTALLYRQISLGREFALSQRLRAQTGVKETL